MLAVMAGGGYGGYLLNENDKTRKEKAKVVAQKNADRYKRCLSVVQSRLEPGSPTAIVRLRSLSQAEQSDCGLAKIPDPVHPDSIGRVSYAHLEYEEDSQLENFIGSAGIDPVIELATTSNLQNAITHEKSQAAREIDVGSQEGSIIGGVFLGLMSFGGGVIIRARHQARQS